MRVSILISSHNYARFLGEAIDSALAQRDGGPDGLPVPPPVPRRKPRHKKTPVETKKPVRRARKEKPE